jgi:hypothetical protein
VALAETARSDEALDGNTTFLGICKKIARRVKLSLKLIFDVLSVCTLNIHLSGERRACIQFDESK